MALCIALKIQKNCLEWLQQKILEFWLLNSKDNLDFDLLLIALSQGGFIMNAPFYFFPEKMRSESQIFPRCVMFMLCGKIL